MDMTHPKADGARVRKSAASRTAAGDMGCVAGSTLDSPDTPLGRDSHCGMPVQRSTHARVPGKKSTLLNNPDLSLCWQARSSESSARRLMMGLTLVVKGMGHPLHQVYGLFLRRVLSCTDEVTQQLVCSPSLPLFSLTGPAMASDSAGRSPSSLPLTFSCNYHAIIVFVLTAGRSQTAP